MSGRRLLSELETLAADLAEACRNLTESERDAFRSTFAEAPPFTSGRVSRLFELLLRMVEEADREDFEDLRRLDSRTGGTSEDRRGETTPPDEPGGEDVDAEPVTFDGCDEPED
jgi:hypothetical protein